MTDLAPHQSERSRLAITRLTAIRTSTLKRCTRASWRRTSAKKILAYQEEQGDGKKRHALKGYLRVRYQPTLRGQACDERALKQVFAGELPEADQNHAETKLQIINELTRK